MKETKLERKSQKSTGSKWWRRSRRDFAEENNI
jgi:hypothetical protein